MKKLLVNPLSLFFIGLGLGVISRLFDIYFEVLGKVFSQVAIWILFGTLVAIYSQSKIKAMLNVFSFCIGMLIAYYVTAYVTHGVYSQSFIIGWTVFAFCSPGFAFFTWMTKEAGVFPKMISVGIVTVSILSSVLLFDRLHFYDFVIDASLIYLLFFKRIDRRESDCER